jgi:hypothetical protein
MQADAKFSRAGGRPALYLPFIQPCIILLLPALRPQTDQQMSNNLKTTAGPGRPKGSVNKTTATLKAAILDAAAKYGQDGKGKGKLTGYCFKLAHEEPRAFAQLLGKVLPMQVAGPDDKDGLPTAIQINIVDAKR